MNISWNAAGYAKDFGFVPQYGLDVLNLVREGDGGLAVDLGCGSGALTARLAEKGYKVIGIDASAEMLEIARKANPATEFILSSAEEFSLPHKADVIFSNAVFHWIDAERQDLLVSNIAENLKSGGELVAEFGGKGCAEAVHSTLERLFEKHGLKYPRTFYFPTIGEYAPVLERHGFRVEYAVLFDRPTVQKSERGLVDWIRMFNTKPFENMDSALREEIEKEAETELKDRLFIDGKWIIDYVRIRFRAVRL